MEMTNTAYALDALGEKIKELEQELRYATMRAEVAEDENAKLKQKLAEKTEEA